MSTTAITADGIIEQGLGTTLPHKRPIGTPWVRVMPHRHPTCLHPERAEVVNDRKAFLKSLAFSALSTRELFDRWRAPNWMAVCKAR